jgi:hypothetical protein
MKNIIFLATGILLLFSAAAAFNAGNLSNVNGLATLIIYCVYIFAASVFLDIYLTELRAGRGR